MICLDYRRALLAGEGESEAMTAHRLGCVSCAEVFSEHLAFESELRLGLEVAPPQGFEHRLLRSRAVKRRQWLAAASVAIVAAGAGLLALRGRDDSLALACIDFVMKEEAKSIMMGAMPRADAARVLAGTLPLERIERVGQVRHIGPCPFNGATAYHVVLAVPQGKVTLLIMPAAVPRAPSSGTKEGLHAAVVALAKGSVGIVGGDAAVVDSVAGALRA
jgi:hypothetical protein